MLHLLFTHHRQRRRTALRPSPAAGPRPPRLSPFPPAPLSKGPFGGRLFGFRPLPAPGNGPGRRRAPGFSPPGKGLAWPKVGLTSPSAFVEKLAYRAVGLSAVGGRMPSRQFPTASILWSRQLPKPPAESSKAMQASAFGAWGARMPCRAKWYILYVFRSPFSQNATLQMQKTQPQNPRRD